MIKPVLGRFKVYMIDEVHMLSNTAFNAMLKTLEEPPEYLKFVLATTDPQKVPVTVLSRCLQFNLRPMAPQTVQAHLEQVLQAESVPAEVGALRLLSRAARGSMRDALSLADQAIAFGGGALEEASWVLDYGRGKYVEWNWAKGQAWSIPIGCIGRHINWGVLRGEELDPESQKTHRGHVVANLIFLFWFLLAYPEGDDRPDLPGLKTPSRLVAP